MIHSRYFIGLSCGSSGDSIDAVLVEVQGVGLGLNAKLIQSFRRPLPREVQDEMNVSLLALGTHEPALHRMLGESLLATANQLLTQIRFEPGRVMAVGVFAPLAWHEPAGRTPSTREYGMVSLLADRLGLTVVSDFREQDVAAGGQGMPQTALADSLLFRTETEERVLIHLGSVFSIVLLKASKRVQDVLAFETGPGHRLLDAVIRVETNQRERFDPGGRYAVQGRCFDSLVERWLGHSYFSIKPPKSLGRSEFGEEFIGHAIRHAAQENATLQDLLCSLSHFLIRGLVLSCRRWVPEMLNERPVWLSGGGTRNGLLWRLIEQYVPTWKLNRLDELGLPALARSATGAAILAALTLDGVSASTPNATGTVGRMLGRLTPGNSQNWSRCLRWMLTQSSELVSPYRAA
jgi:anhydro-N-acetylmuramic acid kinase